MQTRLTLRPGQRGTKRLARRFGDRLVAVRYRYDAYVIACALNTDTPLLSLDGGQRDAARRAGVSVIELDELKP